MSQIDQYNEILAGQLLFTDPVTGEELHPTYTTTEEDGIVLYVRNQDGTRCWKHTIKTGEV